MRSMEQALFTGKHPDQKLLSVDVASLLRSCEECFCLYGMQMQAICVL